MRALVEPEPPVLDVPAGEGSGGLLDVFLGVIAHAQAEQFHQLPCKVLVGFASAVGVSVQPDKHSRVLRHRLEQGMKRSRSPAKKELHLVHHQSGIPDLCVACGEVVMPEQRELVPGGTVAPEHPVGPPGLDRFGAADSALAVGYRLHLGGLVAIRKKGGRGCARAELEDLSHQLARGAKGEAPGEMGGGRIIPGAILSGAERFEPLSGCEVGAHGQSEGSTMVFPLMSPSRSFRRTASFSRKLSSWRSRIKERNSLRSASCFFASSRPTPLLTTC